MIVSFTNEYPSYQYLRGILKRFQNIPLYIHDVTVKSHKRRLLPSFKCRHSKIWTKTRVKNFLSYSIIRNSVSKNLGDIILKTILVFDRTKNMINQMNVSDLHRCHFNEKTVLAHLRPKMITSGLNRK